jgi:hypothetical protein
MLTLQVNTIGWTGDVHLDSFSKSELDCLLHTLPFYNHRLIPTNLHPLHIAPPTPLCPMATICDPSPPTYQLDVTGSIVHLPPLDAPALPLRKVHMATSYIVQHFPLPPLPTILIWPTSLKPSFQLVTHSSLSHSLNIAAITLLTECKD